MEESLKYFKPEISDIRVGYECEVNWSINPGQVEEWKSIKWTTEEFSNEEEGFIQVRVLFLTKKQIEAEGWECIGEYPGGALLCKKGQYELVTSTDYRMKISKVWKSFEGEPDEKEHRKDLYNGGCKDINTFRQICKLLGV